MTQQLHAGRPRRRSSISSKAPISARSPFSLIGMAAALVLLAACESGPAETTVQGTGTGLPSETSSLPVISGPQNTAPPSAEVTAQPDPVIPFPTTSTAEQPAPPVPEIVRGVADGKVRVGLLLPLTGDNAAVGQALLNAAQLALFDFADDTFELLTHDTRGTAQGAVDAITLAIGDGAELIIGPLLASSVRAIRPIATRTATPVISFTSDRTAVGSGIYTLGFLPSAQVERVVSFARSQGLTRFALLAPDDAYGRTVVQSFRSSVGSVGGSVDRLDFYNPGAQDFSAVVRTMADYEVRRANLLAQRQELEQRGDEVSLRALQRLANLQTAGDLPYDALMVADGGARLQALAALLPFYDIDPAKIRILGTGQWDVAGIGAEPALVGGWYAAPDPRARQEFEASYRQTFGATPPRLATLAYDAAALAAVLAADPAGTRFSAEVLADPNGFAGRDGIFRFLPDGTSQRGLAVLQVRERENRVVSPAPETFQAQTN